MYNVIVSSAVYESKDGCYEWAEGDVESKVVETHDTIEECLDSVAEWGRRWAMWPSLIIEDEEGSEVYSEISASMECDKCGHTEYNRVVSDLRDMRKQ